MKKLIASCFLPLMLLACDNNDGNGDGGGIQPDAKPDAFVTETKKIVDITADDTEPVDISTIVVTQPDDREAVEF